MLFRSEYLGLEAEEREIYFDEVKDFAECGLCGTAAVISPVGKIVDLQPILLQLLLSDRSRNIPSLLHASTGWLRLLL